jgi:hypothetical protein
MDETKFIIEAIDKMLNIAGYELTYEDLVKDKDWISKYSMTSKQHDEWEKWFIRAAVKKKISPCTKFAKQMFQWHTLDIGLKIKD